MYGGLLFEDEKAAELAGRGLREKQQQRAPVAKTSAKENVFRKRRIQSQSPRRPRQRSSSGGLLGGRAFAASWRASFLLLLCKDRTFLKRGGARLMVRHLGTTPW